MNLFLTPTGSEKMKCPYCEHDEIKVVETRETTDKITRRRRECLNCEKRFTTYEKIELIEIRVIKKDGKRELFDKAKLEKGILIACEKRPISQEKINKLLINIENKLKNRNSLEIPSKSIGNLVMTRLKRIDKIAYIRFASVYRDFEDVSSFKEELDLLNK